MLFVLHTTYPCPSVLADYSGEIELQAGVAGGASHFSFDWRGSGRSTAPVGGVTFSDLVDDVEAVAGAIGEPFDINAVNDGCGVALAFAARRPELVRRMLLVAPQGRHARADPFREEAWQAYRAHPLPMLHQFLITVHPRTDPDETMALARAALEATPMDVTEALVRAAHVDLEALAPCVSTPALIIAGGGSEFEDSIELAAVLPAARARHWAQIGDGSINGAAWREAWDEAFPPGRFAGATPPQRAIEELTARETEVLGLVCKGLSNAEIGEALVIAPSTAKRHVVNVFAKLGVSNRGQAIALAHERGLVERPRATRR